MLVGSESIEIFSLTILKTHHEEINLEEQAI